MKLKRDAASKDPKSKDPKAIANAPDGLPGSWIATGYSIQGTEEPGKGALPSMLALARQTNGLENIRLTITDDQWVLENAPDEADQYTINAAKNPAEIDLIHPDGSTSNGIWRLHDKNKLEVCFSLQGERPKAFDATRPVLSVLRSNAFHDGRRHTCTQALKQSPAIKWMR